VACMTRLLAFEVALVGLVSVFAGGAGCSSTSSNAGAADAAAMTTDGHGGVSDDGPIDALALADGGCIVPSVRATCTFDETPCQPSDRCSVGYEWFCNAISNSWQKGFLSCGDAATCRLGAACSSTELCIGDIAGCTSNCQCLDGTWQAPCPMGLPQTGSACTPEGAECGYVTSTNACGADNCYCKAGAWSCGPSSCIIDADTGTGTDAGTDGGGGADVATDSGPLDAGGG
jgi:hypothetical protein